LAKVDYVVEQLRQGRNAALVTDAGTPGISDPGGKLIREITTTSYLVDLKIVPVPGPSALTAAASISGFPTDKFLFLGFPPAKRKRKKFFEEVADSKHSVIFYESSHRVMKTLKEISSFIGNREMVVYRELTKQFESVYRGRVEGIIKTLESNKNNLKGEFVVIVKNG
jgi:16S rRNA (cytidine1402-2'-O)-methyltransferase